MKDVDAGVLSCPDLGVVDLYVDLALVRSYDAQAMFREFTRLESFAHGAECLSEAVAYLRDAAERLSSADWLRRECLRALAEDLLAEAAAFELSADLLEAAGGPRTE